MFYARVLSYRIVLLKNLYQKILQQQRLIFREATARSLIIQTYQTE